MLGRPEDAKHILSTYTYARKVASFSITSDCPLKCRHCYYAGQKDKRQFPFEQFCKILDRLPRDWKIDFHGGEPMAHPQTLKKYVDEAKARGLYTCIATSGFFGDDDAKIDYLYDKIKPALITISIDKYHQEHVKLETILHLIDRQERYKDTLTGFLTAYTYNRETNPKNKNTNPILAKLIEIYGAERVQYIPNLIVVPIGAAASLPKEELFDMTQCYDKPCFRIGFDVQPNGDLKGFCSWFGKSCHLGNIFTDDLEAIKRGDTRKCAVRL